MAWSGSDRRRIIVQLFAGIILVITPSFAAQAASEQRCREYAQSAIADYRQLRNIPKCSKLRPQDTVRWHPQYDRHFSWCLKAQQAWLTDETRQRDALLIKCGGRSKY
jgi:hypothetical protein